MQTTTNKKEYSHNYYLKHKEEFRVRSKRYYSKHKNKILIRNLNWREKNKQRWSELCLNNQKKVSYKYEKTPEQRAIRYVKRRTRIKYPLSKALKCEFCDNGATEHHHNTVPIQVDKFNYACHHCHIQKNRDLISERGLK